MAAGDLLVYFPLVLVTLLAVPVVLLPVSVRAELLVSRLALPIFGGYVAEPTPQRRDQIRRMRAAFVGESHRVFQSQTLFIAGVAGVVGSVYGIYVGAAVLRSLAADPALIAGVLPGQLAPLATRFAVVELSGLRLFGLLAVTSAMLGAGLAAGTYWGRWTILGQRARARGVEIDATLPRTVAFVYALSRSGMPFQAVLRTLSRNQDVYGEAARELGVAVRDIDAFGTDVLTALRETADRTPSENLEEFTENLASVLLSGQSVSGFLHEQYERFQEEVEAQQRQYLDLLSTFAEVYVTVLVAGPLFFITVLVVVGLVIQDTLVVIRLVTYLGIPLATFGFVVYVDSITEGLDVVSRSGTGEEKRADMDPRGRMASGPDKPGNGGVGGVGGVADGGTVRGRNPDPGTDADNWLRLTAYDRIGRYRRTLSDPVGLVLDRPVYSLLVTGPIGLVIVLLSLNPSVGEAGRLLRGGTAVSSAPVLGLIEVVDGPVVLATIVALLGIAVAHEIEKRRLRAVEAEMPDFLDRMASVNEAGATIVGSLNRLSDAELGPLGDEIQRVWRDIEWGATVGEALARMERRTGTPTVSRSVTLIRNAIAASGDIGPVLRIAADEAKEIRRLERERRQEMLTYLVVIYVSFLVFLGIIVALTVSFIPAIEAAGAAGGAAGGSGGVGGVAGVDPGIIGGVGSVDTGAYEVLFFHAAAIQGVCSGLVAGQLGEGTAFDGVKHATVLLVLTYAVFAFL
ncbi:type II secretion protein F [Halobellus salinus]|uniref:Type II secretion protein F n=1 Tax=Halobellus salinus TaxID=931585 RepID=A0A830EKL9_9EURY|nr:type II secretion system F family protein [Halobellus salinus]GGJ00106.1 type II secretion protein F [Halobellus salinus]SMP01925.1 flagellar protein FlaJ [Halobellus salinus]